jgi:hypothetical protein
MEKKQKQRSAQKTSIDVKINLDRFKLALKGDDAFRALQEVNKILDKLNKMVYDPDEVPLDYRLENMLSDELTMDGNVSKMLNSLSQIYPHYHTTRSVVENKKIIEIEKGRVHNQIDDKELKKKLNKLFFNIQKDRVKHIVIHVKGNIPEEEANKIVDNIEKDLPSSETSKLFTKSDIPNHTVIECVFFGEFTPDYNELD